MTPLHRREDCAECDCTHSSHAGTPTGLWTCDGQPSPDVVEYSRPILLEALRTGVRALTISGYRWDYVAVLEEPTP
jgi:hypothetical protein